MAVQVRNVPLAYIGLESPYPILEDFGLLLQLFQNNRQAGSFYPFIAYLLCKLL